MKRSAVLFTLLFVWLTATGAAFGQQGCEFNIIGTWRAGSADAVLYRFAPDGTITVLSVSGPGQSSDPQEIASATYELDNPKAPKSIALNTTNKNRVFLYGKSSIKIVEYTDTSMTCVVPGLGTTRWVKVDPNRYFIVLAARKGEFYDTSGPAFPMLIKVVGRESQIDAVGTYSDHGKGIFGPVPPEAYKDFLREPRTDSEVMLRLEINSAQYERALKILRHWERRVREDALLYPTRNPLNNVLLVKAVTETLNQCSEEFKLYRLNYLVPEDWIADKYDPQFIPFVFFKELRRLNESRHVGDDKFQQATLPSVPPQGH
jgi:hypothetical protein